MLDNSKGLDWRQLLPFLLHKTPAKSPLRFKQIHALFLTTGLALHSLPFSRLLLLSPSLSPSLSYSSSLLIHSPLPPSPFLSNTLISSLAVSGHHFLALSLLSSTKFSPNSHTFPSLLKACSFSPPLLPIGLLLHARLLKILPFPLDPFVLTSLITLHSRRGRRIACRKLFEQIPSPDLPAWNAILSCSAAREVLSLFQRLQLSGAEEPNEITFLAVVRACGELGAIGLGLWAHACVRRRRRLAVNCFLGAGLIEMYGKCGRLELARQVFDGLPEKDAVCYNSMMRGLAAHGEARGALGLLGEMEGGGRGGGVRPDEVSFLLAMSACAHAGLVEDGRRCFDRMEELGISPKAEHYGCLVDILGRSGKLEEAGNVVRRMPMEPDATLFRALLGACRVHNEVQIDGEVVSKLMELDPDHGGNYVLLSNVYACFGRWDGAALVRKEMRDRGIEKNPGLSSVEIDGVVEEFSIGDQTHPKVKEIYEMIHQISRRFHE